MLLSLIISLTIQTSNVNTTLQLNRNYATNTAHTFVLGDSVSQTEEKILADERQLVAAHKGGGESFTGQGSNIKIIGYSNEQCITYFKRQKGINVPLGYAGNIVPNSQTPQVGEGALGKNHISLITEVGDGWIRVIEANWIRGAITERTIPMNKIKGYLVI